MGAFLLRLVRLGLYLGLTLPLMPVQALALALGAGLARRLPRFYHRLCCRVLGFDLEVVGRPATQSPVLFVANHTSYLDITILGAVIDGSFVAKAEVRRWPLFGWLAKLQRTVFVDRAARHAAHAQRDSVTERLAAGDNLVLFPEGTSDDGNHVLPFKTTLFAAASFHRDGRPVTVQPVSIAYVRLDGIPMGRAYRPFFAWYGDMSMAPHLWTVLGLGTVGVVVVFHRPVTVAEFGSRKALAAYCHRIVAAGLAAALSGRLPPSETAAPDAAPPEAAPDGVPREDAAAAEAAAPIGAALEATGGG